MNKLKGLFLLLICLNLTAQDFESFYTGNESDAETNPEFGICLMGGASENDNAMQWFLNRSDGGDVLVIRTSGGDGYNDYMFNQLGVNINSVETLKINNSDGATDPYVLQKVSQAEAIWFAGGDQADYVNFFKNNAFEELINNHINTKQYPIGGISAGMAIMGEFYFDALNGTVTSAEALNNPFNEHISLGRSDFISNPFLTQTITDTHYDNPDREGRHMAFLARLQNQTGERVFGIGLDEFTAACINEIGTARIFGEFPSYDDYAYFIQINCLDNTQPENLSQDEALEWSLNQQAVKAYKVPGNPDGSNQFNLSTWQTGIGGEWQNWWVDQGSFQSSPSVSIDCETFSITEFKNTVIDAYPNPVDDYLNISSTEVFHKIEVFDLLGNRIKIVNGRSSTTKFNLGNTSIGVYFVKIYFENDSPQILKVIKN